MASKVTSKALKGTDYGVIQRGASFTLPVEVKDETDKPIDLTGYRVEFTIKKVKTDFDRHDDFAYVAKSFLPQMPEQGKLFVVLSSDDLDFEPGKYYFDVELTSKDGMVFRLFTFEFTLDGGPTNRRVNKGMGQWPMGDTITVVTLSEGNPVIVVAPTVNLDGDVFGYLATLMEMVDSLKKTRDEDKMLLDTTIDWVKELDGRIDALEQQTGSDHVEVEEALGKLDELLENKIPEIEEEATDLRETLENQGKTITKHRRFLDDLRKKVHELHEHYVTIAKLLKLNP